MEKLLIEVLKNNLDFDEIYLKEGRGGLGQIGCQVWDDTW